MFNNIAIPIIVEMTLSGGMILFLCGPIYFFNTLISVYLYIKLTKRLAENRKKVIVKNYGIEKDLNKLMNESSENFFNFKIFNN